jgi:hypothetical protein
MHYSALAQQVTQLKVEVVADMVNVTAAQSNVLMDKLFAAQKLATVHLPRESILSSLQYPDMANRRGAISEPSRSTYSWMFENKPSPPHPVTFMSWLESGNGIFWITGKAGSGKSTLMKYIWDHEKTSAGLKRWANGRKILTTSHYFWYLGSTMEKSYSGLIRSISYGIFDSCPALMETATGSRWSYALEGRDVRSMAWSNTELRDCLDALVTSELKVKDQNVCFCFFVDGLDEFDGDYEVVDALVRLASTGHTKICASSRPWNKFEVAFTASKQGGDYLELRQQTQHDIAKHADQELSSTLASVGRRNEEWLPLLREVTDRSEGVFLWATLVVKKELRPMLEARESIASVRERLTMIPSGSCFLICYTAGTMGVLT